MQDRFKKAYENLLEKWKSLESKQKIRISALAIVIVISIAVTAFLATRPEWYTLLSNRSYDEISQCQQILTDLGYKVRPSNGGTALDVLKKDSVQARIDLSTQNIKTSGEFTFDDALNFAGVSSTEMVKKNVFIKNKESELAKSISLIDGIEESRVSIAMPENNSYFIENTEKPSVSILVNTKGNLEKEVGESIARLATASIVGLTMDSIEIIDNRGNSVYSGSLKNLSPTNSKENYEIVKKNEIENKTRSLLIPLYDVVNISTQLSFDWDKNTRHVKTFTPPVEGSEVGVPTIKNSERQKVKNGTVQAAEGLEENDNTTAEYNIENPSSQGSLDVKSDNEEYLYNSDELTTEYDTGKIIPEQSSMSLSLYRYKTYDQEVMEKNGELQGTTWEAFQSTVQTQKIDVEDEIIEVVQNGSGIENVKIIAREIPIFKDKVEVPPKVGEIVVFAVLAALILLLAYGLIKTTKPDEITEIEPELSVEDLLVSTQLEEVKEEELAKLDEINYNKESEVKKQIEKFVSEKPEAVAQLLRNWLNEDWK